MSTTTRMRLSIMILTLYLLRRLNRWYLLSRRLTIKPFEITDCASPHPSSFTSSRTGRYSKGYTSYRGLANFRGIPYTSNSFRFKRSVVTTATTHEDCARFAFRCPQNSDVSIDQPLRYLYELTAILLWNLTLGFGMNVDARNPKPLDVNQHEFKSLTLNVCAPIDAIRMGGDLRPVLVFFHGGAFEMGHAAEKLYARPWGNAMATKDVVVVTANYRLGLFGYTKVIGGDFNNGLSDQVCVLEWVAKNIEEFGGDPARVTVMGQSAGAMSVGAMLVSPKTKGLFQRAILMSGASFNVITKEENARTGEYIRQALDVKELSIEELSKFSTEQLISAQIAATRKIKSKGAVMPFQPTIDGEFILGFPHAFDDSKDRGTLESEYMRKDMFARNVDLLVGTTSEEAWLFRRYFPIAPFSRWSFLKFVTPFVEALNRADVAVTGEQLVDAYLAKHCPKNRKEFEKAFFHFVSHYIFDVPATLLCEAHAEACKTTGKKTFRYRFHHPGPLGSVHGIDLPFVFGTIEAIDEEPLMERFLGPLTPDLKRASEEMVVAWTNFVKFGNPNCRELGATWPQFTTLGRGTFLFDFERGHSSRVATEEEITHRDDDPAFDVLVRHRHQSMRAFGTL